MGDRQRAHSANASSSGGGSRMSSQWVDWNSSGYRSPYALSPEQKELKERREKLIRERYVCAVWCNARSRVVKKVEIVRYLVKQLCNISIHASWPDKVFTLWCILFRFQFVFIKQRQVFKIPNIIVSLVLCEQMDLFWFFLENGHSGSISFLPSLRPQVAHVSPLIFSHHLGAYFNDLTYIATERKRRRREDKKKRSV